MRRSAKKTRPEETGTGAGMRTGAGTETGTGTGAATGCGDRTGADGLRLP